MKPAFSVVRKNYPMEKKSELFKEMGWDDLIDNKAYDNTCAIRISYALQKSGFSVASGAKMKGLKGSTKGKLIEISQARLTKDLWTKWGAPETFKASEAIEKIGSRDGIIVFEGITSYPLPGGGFGGHIDFYDGADTIIKTRTVPYWIFWERTETYEVTERSEVGSGAYFKDAKTVLFWELN